MTHDMTLIPFELADQFGRPHTDAECNGRVTVVLGTDRGGSRYTAQWLAGVRDALEGIAGVDRMQIFGVANVRGVPSLLRRVVTAVLPKSKDAAVLLDWEGQFAAAYDFAAGSCTVLVVDRAGHVALRTQGRKPTPEQLGEVAEALRSLLGDGAAAEVA